MLDGFVTSNESKHEKVSEATKNTTRGCEPRAALSLCFGAVRDGRCKPLPFTLIHGKF